ncbi:MAG: hypothetical protein H7X95_01090, partial [Deltaproteobacteria bacterium]|nr:hypothetical protein [Deltaproteobacteria bacterium]
MTTPPVAERAFAQLPLLGWFVFATSSCVAVVPPIAASGGRSGTGGLSRSGGNPGTGGGVASTGGNTTGTGSAAGAMASGGDGARSSSGG